jgi:hypothetical protein
MKEGKIRRRPIAFNRLTPPPLPLSDLEWVRREVIHAAQVAIKHESTYEARNVEQRLLDGLVAAANALAAEDTAQNRAELREWAALRQKVDPKLKAGRSSW